MGRFFCRTFPAGLGSSKNLALHLLKARRNLGLNLSELSRLGAGRFRFDTF